MLRVPSALEYRLLPWAERKKAVAYLEAIRLTWLETEAEAPRHDIPIVDTQVRSASALAPHRVAS